MDQIKDIDVASVDKVFNSNQLVDEYKQAIIRISLTPEVEQMIQKQMASLSNSFITNVIQQYKLLPFTEFASQQSKMMSAALENIRVFMKTNLYGVIPIESIQHAHNSWFLELQQNLSCRLQLETSLRTSVSQIVTQLAFVNEFVAERDLMFTSTISVNSLHVNSLNTSVADMLKAYNALISSFKDSIQNIINYPKDLFESTNRELCTSIGMIHESKSMLYHDVTPRKIEYGEFGCSIDQHRVVGLLNEVDSCLSKMLLGAHQSLESKSVDKARQVLVSLRELVKHTINLLVPESCVLSWLKNNDPAITKARPSFEEKIQYMIDKLPNDEYGMFARGDINAKVAILDVLNGVHQRDLCYDDEGLLCIISSVESFLCYLITINKTLCESS